MEGRCGVGCGVLTTPFPALRLAFVSLPPSFCVGPPRVDVSLVSQKSIVFQSFDRLERTSLLRGSG